MNLTPARARALQIVRDHPGIGPAAFALAMWPDSDGHTKRSRRHDAAGGAVGAGIKMSAGVFLGRLTRDGLLAWEPAASRFGSRYFISAEGRRALDAMAGSDAHSGT